MEGLTNEEHAEGPWIECWVIVDLNDMRDNLLRGCKGSCPFGERFGVVVTRKRHFLNSTGLIHISALLPKFFADHPRRGFVLNQAIWVGWRRRHVEELTKVVMSQESEVRWVHARVKKKLSGGVF